MRKACFVIGQVIVQNSSLSHEIVVDIGGDPSIENQIILKIWNELPAQITNAN